VKKKYSRKVSILIMCALVLSFSIYSCEKIDEELKDPSEAGKWTLYNTSTGLPGNQVRGSFCDSKGDMWFAVSGQGAAKYANGTWTYYNTSNSGILSNGVTCIGEDRDGNILLGTTNGVSILSTANVWAYYRHPTYTLNVSCILTDKEGNIWVGTSNRGFLIFDGSQIAEIYYEAFKTVNDIEQDSKGNVWIGTDNGLLKWDGNSFSLMTMTDGLPDNIVTALFNDSRNRLWIGTYFGRTVSWIDGQGIRQLSLFNDRIVEINDICEDAAGNIWFATYTSGLIKFDNVVPYSYKKYNGLPEDDILTSVMDNHGNVWFGLYSKGLTRYSLPID
jgi:ligand-binding sensor domain-containing protein